MCLTQYCENHIKYVFKPHSIPVSCLIILSEMRTPKPGMLRNLPKFKQTVVKLPGLNAGSLRPLSPPSGGVFCLYIKKKHLVM